MSLSSTAKTSTADARTRFLVIDDHPLFRDALHSAVSLAYPAAQTFEAASISEAVKILETNPGIDLALLDLIIPGVRGFDGLVELRTRFSRLPIVVVSGHEESRVVRQVISFGAAGLIPKSFKKSELADAIRQVLEGAVFLPPGYDESDQDDEEANRQEMIKRFALLTPQQTRVLNMIREGLLNKQIAYELQVGETTVKAHVSEILKKLQVVSRTQAAIEASKLTGESYLRLAEQLPTSNIRS